MPSCAAAKGLVLPVHESRVATSELPGTEEPAEKTPFQAITYFLQGHIYNPCRIMEESDIQVPEEAAVDWMGRRIGQALC